MDPILDFKKTIEDKVVPAVNAIAAILLVMCCCATACTLKYLFS